MDTTHMQPYPFKKIHRDKLQPGDLFSLQMDDGRFGFGRIIARINDGHVAEIFDAFAATPSIDPNAAHRRLTPLVVLDAYGLFQRKTEGNWGIVGKTENYRPDPETARARFAWGLKGHQKATDLSDRFEPIDDAEAELLPRCAPKGDYDVQQLIQAALAKA
ncbi:Imm26 family immunity protein [Pseudomonas sp. CGJS7]|uniref:Imm26 family immunity protein n=1 Tax=Pseudomonas sp. CGJS7 TaxID=3109348 RepID=UPI00300AFE9F